METGPRLRVSIFVTGNDEPFTFIFNKSFYDKIIHAIDSGKKSITISDYHEVPYYFVTDKITCIFSQEV